MYIYKYEGIEATLNNQAKKPIAAGVIIKYLILTLNNSAFRAINYLQKKGCAIGTICTPAYANIFMEKFEKLHIYSYLKKLFQLFAVDL